MSIKVAIRHRTEYRFDRPVAIAPHIVRLRPAPHSRTPIEAYSLKVEPAGHFINWQQDPFANYMARLVFPEKARSLLIDVEVIADMTVINPFDFFLEERAQAIPFAYDKGLQRDLAPYLEIVERGPLLMQWLAPWRERLAGGATPTVDFLVALNLALQQHIGYIVRMEPGVQACEQTLTLRLGSCRDTAWLLVQVLRHLGMAARFVSGYLVQLTADIKSVDGPAGPAEDFTDLHAWAELYLPGAGWVGLDPTSGLFAGEGHIPLAATPEPSSAAPVTGATDPCEVDFSFENTVTRVHEDPRVTKPYSSVQWQAIDQLGQQVDRELQREDVRLTMGGEPTFIAIDDMDGPEWNFTALSPRKRQLAGDLMERLRGRFAPGGLVHVGQGKWYPGEPLPRWALSVFWREDGQPVWGDAALLARQDAPAAGGQSAADAAAFARALSEQLGLGAEFLVPGYEDDLHYLLQEGNLPVNLEPDDNQLVDPQERARLRRVFDDGLERIVGYALPLGWRSSGGSSGYWQSSRWSFKRGKMLLVPGDSPMGLRLPLNSLPWDPPEKRELEPERDPFDGRAGSPDAPAADGGVPAAGRISDTVLHTALCVELRQGHVHVFMPPLKHFEVYQGLLNTIEAVARERGVALVIEGYEPPRDHRVHKLQITPDPGVIEVNIHPAHDWPQLVSIIETLYEEARLCRLGTEKFMLDGRHTGTGGGNHVTLGAAESADSPFLRRPELLRSLISYWQNHPSLSYLFSGMFIGPTSQAPRVDEARDDNLYELEIAFGLLPEGECRTPWLVDRVLRNFLIDLTGNTHRAEFCIDKLYSPDGPAGRLGLVEFRNFEMPPHPQMSAVQMLLLRALVASFWRKPCRLPLVRWGTELHDRFMLPHFVWEDFRHVIDDLVGAGYAFRPEWFAPFHSFRFPHYGTIHVGDLQLELHGAIEPWHVLGEESSGQGTSRYVDSSVERLQVKVQGLTGDRYAVCCNGRRLPLRSTGTRGEYIAGVRYKAWAPYSALHPTIGVHTPLVFDVVDTYHQRSVGGCTYHVSHPGGRNYDTLPVNGNEAEARRVARFWPHGFTQGNLSVAPAVVHPDAPYTLDLRWPAPPAG